MATLFAPPELFSALSYAVDGSDPDLRKGTHLRVFAGIGASFPLTPFPVFKVVARQSEPRGLHVTDRDNKPAGELRLEQLGLADVTPMFGDTDTVRTVRLDMRADVDSRIERAELFDHHRRVVAARERPPFMFSAPQMNRFRLRGSAPHVNLFSKSVDIGDIVNPRLPLVAERIIGLPVKGSHAWHVGVQTRQDGLDRVTAGAPLRLNPMDQPDGPFDAVGPSNEVARVEAMLEAAESGGGLETLLAKMVGDPSPPWLQVEKQRMATGGARRDQVAEVPRLSHLQMAAIDPGLARFLGFVDHFDDLPDLHGGGWNVLAVAGLLAIDPKRFDPNGLLNLQEIAPNEGTLHQMIVDAMAARGGEEVRGEIEDLIGRTRARDLLVRAMIAVTAPTPPWLAPSLPKPLLAEHRWQTAADELPSSRYRVSFAFHDAPLATMAALAARPDGEWTPRHGSVEVPGFVPSRRATPRIFGCEQAALASARRHQLPKASGRHPGLLADHDIPAEIGTILYRAWGSDFFGRFGAPAEFDVTPPPRPAPPPPVLRFHVERTAVDPSSPDALSPGLVRLTFAVPQPPPGDRFAVAERDRLASAMVVPAISDLAAGSQPILQSAVSLDAEAQLIDLTVAGMIDVAFVLPPLLPQETRTLTLKASFIDSDGVASAAASLPVKVTDIRPPKVYPIGIGLFWTSAPGPSPEVELQLAWPAPAKSRFRVYITDQQGLGLTAAELAEGVPGAAPSRGRVAQIGGNKVLGGAPVSRANFRLLTTAPVEAGADARAVLKTNLPRSLETVQFLRVVPLSVEGAEAPFDRCGIVPVAVPDSRRPAAPRLEGSVDPATGFATLTVAANGFDGVSLQRDEPGLFDAGAPAAVPPEFLVRRAVGAVNDPIYARQVAAGTLARDAAAGNEVVLSGSATDDNGARGLEPFVRYVYWAHVRLPPERRLPAGVVPITPPGGITVLDPANAESHKRPMSLPSAPRVLMHVPEDPPAAIADAAITATRAAPDGGGAVELTIEIADPPIAHAKAVGPYLLAVWTQWPDQPITAVSTANGAALDGSWPDFSEGSISVTVAPPVAPVAPLSPITLRLALVDPIGRMGAVTTVSLP